MNAYFGCLSIECLASREANRHIQPAGLVRLELKRYEGLRKTAWVTRFVLVAFILSSASLSRISNLQLLKRPQAKLR
ncbi:hypothetical protein D3C87_1980580 [compost metagenome]